MKISNQNLTLSKRVEWTMGHRIPSNHMDRNIHGHRFVLEATIEIKTIPEDFFDIGKLKQCLIQTIVSRLDHSFALSVNDTLMVKFFRDNSKLLHVFMDKEPTMECILNWIAYELKKHQIFQTEIKLKKLILWESPNSSATLEL